MPRPTTATRRRILQASGTIALASLAGCIADGPAAAQDPSASPSPTGDAHDDAGDHPDEEPHADETHHGDDHHETDTESLDDDHSHHEQAQHHHEDLPDHPGDHGEVSMLSTESGEHFSPHVTWIETGTTVTFVDESGAHSATAYHPDNDKPLLMPENGPAFDTGMMSEIGAEQEVTFETPGVYHFYCLPHESLGMIGSLVVGDPDPHDQPALEDPHEVLSGKPAEKIAELNEMVDRMLGHQH